MQGVRYTPYKGNSLMTAIRKGEVQKVRELISSRGLSYSQEWSDASDGYDLLCTAVEKQHTEIAKLLLKNRSKVNNENNPSSNTPLHFAVLNGDIEIVQMLLDRGANINAENLNGKTALHNAVESMSTDIIGMLLSKEANIDVANKSGVTPLHLAVINNSKEITNLLLNRGANVNGTTAGRSAADNGDACTPLHFAVENGNEEITELLLNSGANVDAKGNNGVTSLHIATEKGDLQIVELLLNAGADVNSLYTSSYLEGHTPLHFAVENGSEDIVRLLLNRSVNVNSKGKHGVTCLHIASEKGYSQIVEHLLKHEADVNSAYISSIQRGCTPLHVATEKGDEEIIKLLLSKGADANAAERRGVTPLHIATKNGYSQIVEHLLKHGANIYSTSRNGHTPVYLAVENGDEKVVKLLLDCGAYIDPEDKGIKTMIHFVVEKGCSMIVEYILKHFPDLNNQSNSSVLNAAVQGRGIEYNKIVKNLLQYGFTVNPKDANNFMHVAIEKGHLELVEELLKHGADVNMLSDSTLGEGSIPLHVATKNGHEEIAKLLISFGADVNAQDESGKTPIFYATENADLKMTKLLLNNKATVKDNPEILHIAVKEDRREIVEVLLEHGADVNASDEQGRMPLHFIIFENESLRDFRFHDLRNPTVKGEVARLLLSKGADVKNSMTMLHAAINYNYLEVIEALLEYKADVNSTSEGNMTPLHLSARQGNKVITRMLIEKGANVNAENSDGMTVLHFATQSGHEEIVELLLKHGAKVNVTTKCDLLTPLYLAAEFCYLKIVELLLKYGAKVDSALKGYRLTPLHRAAEKGHIEIVKLLLKFGADVDFVDIYNTTALHYACRRGHGLIVKALLEHGSDITIENESDWSAHAYAKEFQNFHDGFKDDFPGTANVVKTLERHMVQLQVANLYADPWHVKESCYAEELRSFAIKCIKELKRMKSVEFVNTGITLYDILTKDASELAMYARNESISWIFESPQYKTYFPIYGSMININFRKGERRRDSLEQGKKIFGFLFKNCPGLPCGCVETILGYLNDKNLRALIDALKPIEDNSQHIM